ncbi:MAG TPA: hypothetical protein VGS61_03820 [Acidimicrobiales bacterium]|nr:hypothetical protein [Acidimicrobiales bacterium]
MAKARRNPIAQSLIVLSGAAVGYLGGAMPWIDRWHRATHQSLYSTNSSVYHGFVGFWRWSTDNAHIFWSSMGLAMVVLGLALVISGLWASTWATGTVAVLATALGAGWIALLHGSGFTGFDRADLQMGAYVSLVAGLDATIASALVRAHAFGFRARVSRSLRTPTPARQPLGMMESPAARA